MPLGLWLCRILGHDGETINLAESPDHQVINSAGRDVVLLIETLRCRRCPHQWQHQAFGYRN